MQLRKPRRSMVMVGNRNMRRRNTGNRNMVRRNTGNRNMRRRNTGNRNMRLRNMVVLGRDSGFPY